MRNRDRLRPLVDLANLRRLMQLPAQLIERVRKADHLGEREAILAQIALAIELLLMAPVRIKNLTQLSIDRHIRRTRPGGKGLVHLVFPVAEVKNKVDLEFELPAESVAILDLYLTQYRPRLRGHGTPRLFPGGMDNPKSTSTLHQQIKDRIQRETGLTMNPHLFRHLAAKLYLDRHPGEYETVRRLLGHNSIKTTVNFYLCFEAEQATRHYDATILELRSELRDSNSKERP